MALVDNLETLPRSNRSKHHQQGATDAARWCRAVDDCKVHDADAQPGCKAHDVGELGTPPLHGGGRRRLLDFERRKPTGDRLTRRVGRNRESQRCGDLAPPMAKLE